MFNIVLFNTTDYDLKLLSPFQFTQTSEQNHDAFFFDISRTSLDTLQTNLHLADILLVAKNSDMDLMVQQKTASALRSDTNLTPEPPLARLVALLVLMTLFFAVGIPALVLASSGLERQEILDFAWERFDYFR